jgi:anti-sigma-K factor RskA
VPQVPRAPRRTLWRGLVAAATALVLAVAGFTVWRTANTDPNQTIADQVLAAADATTVTHNLPGGAQAKVVRSASLHKAVLVTKDMPAAPNGKVYQLWLEDPTGHMASAGLMPPGTDQVVILDGDASKATGAGITVEPAGGSGQPTSAPVVLFSFA